MATVNPSIQHDTLPVDSTINSGEHHSADLLYLQEVLEQIGAKIAPVWPLQDYVAVNPYHGFSDQEFLSTRQRLRSVSNLETLMSLDYYRDQFTKGEITKSDLYNAVDELVADGVAGAEQINVNQLLASLKQATTSESVSIDQDNAYRTLFTITETLDSESGTHWSDLVLDEISKHCAQHYDTGQSLWQSSWKELSLFQAWKKSLQYDCNMEMTGLKNFRSKVADLPDNPISSLLSMLYSMGIPQELWEDFLFCEALTMPGWSAWMAYQQRETEQEAPEQTALADLLAIRMAHEVALAEQFEVLPDWESVREQHMNALLETKPLSAEELERQLLLKTSEIVFRQKLLGSLKNIDETPSPKGEPKRSLAQMVFCIDVRSERVRRQIENLTDDIQTFGFAGFFGLPIQFVQSGEQQGRSQVPVLLSPKFKVYEEPDVDDAQQAKSFIRNQIDNRFLKKSIKEIQSAAVSCFSFVETVGLLYGVKLLSKSLGLPLLWSRLNQFFSSAHWFQPKSTDTTLNAKGPGTSYLVELAENILRGIGLSENHARLIVLCGHGCHTENNPLKGGLECGACGGHSGESNARYAAKLLNQNEIRQGLKERGISIPDDTRFVAALHNTTTDEFTYFDLRDLPQTHWGDLQELQRITANAAEQTRRERLIQLPGLNTNDLTRRSTDWSEVRPEWGLAGNAAFIAAPRELTKLIDLDGRSFLHSYDHQKDSGYAVLEQIMTAPMIVAHWINMQYYASTVDPEHFGSGNKTIHNVTGRFGILSGNGGDLKTGLPWQSIHDGTDYRHHPLRLLVVLAAPREAITSIVDKHELVRNLLANDWLQLIAVEEGAQYRHTPQLSWEELTSKETQFVEC